ncbi:MAG: endonuclease/exonuclease/phosphatase family protein [Candidatus Acidiferrales bacterium]
MHLSRAAVILLWLLAAIPWPRAFAQGSAPPSLEPESGQLATAPAGAPGVIRIVSFNVHHADDVPALTLAIQRNSGLCSADVFLLQEMESFPAEGASRTRKLAERLGLNYVYAPARLKEAGDGTHGLAVLSRFPLSEVEVIPLKQYGLGVNTRRRIALGVTLELGERRLRLYNVHLDTRINARQRIEQLQPIVEAARRYGAAEVVIGGDFNTNPFYWLLPVLPVFRSNQAKAVDDFMGQKGFATPFAEAGGTIRKWGGRFRVDTIYGRGLTARGFAVEESVAVSDHFPVWVDLAWTEKPAATP